MTFLPRIVCCRSLTETKATKVLPQHICRYIIQVWLARSPRALLPQFSFWLSKGPSPAPRRLAPVGRQPTPLKGCGEGWPAEPGKIRVIRVIRGKNPAVKARSTTDFGFHGWEPALGASFWLFKPRAVPATGQPYLETQLKGLQSLRHVLLRPRCFQLEFGP